MSQGAGHSDGGASRPARNRSPYDVPARSVGHRHKENPPMGVAQPLTDRRAPLTPSQEDMIVKLRRHTLETDEPLLRYAEWHKLIVRGLLRGGWVENYPPASLRSYKFQMTPLGIEMADELIALEKDGPAEPDAARLLAFRLVTDDQGRQRAVAEWEITCAHCDERAPRFIVGSQDGIPEAPRYCSRRCNDRSKESRKRKKERQEERAAAKERAVVERGRLRELTEAVRPVGLKSVPTPAVLAPKATPKPRPVPKPAPVAPPAPVTAPPRPRRSAIEAYAGLEWLPRALEAAMHHGVADMLAKIALTHQLHGSMLGVGPEPGYTDGRKRIRSGGYYVTLGKDGVVLAFGEVVTGHGRGAPTRKAATSARRGTHTRSPRTWDELDAWIVEEGCEVRQIGGGHRGVFRDGVRISTLPTSASDHRSLANSIAELRKQGLTLRK